MDNVVMDGDARIAAVRSLARLSESSDYRDRAVAGIGLASFAGLAAADDALRRLVLDPEDTHVTSETTFSLARFADGDAGLAVVASSLRSADEDQANWIESGFEDALSFDPTALDHAISYFGALRAGSDDSSSGAHERLVRFLLDLRSMCV
jgi:hypothetical protein